MGEPKSEQRVKALRDDQAFHPMRWACDNRVRAGAIFLGGLAAVVGLFSCQEGPHRYSMELTAHPATAAGQPEVRVALKTAATKVEAGSSSGIRIEDEKGQCLYESPELAAGSQVSASHAGWYLGGRYLGASQRIELFAGGGSGASGECLQIDGESYGRRVTLVRKSRAQPEFAVVAHLDIEAYLAGVLAAEVPCERWHMEALKAQAVASRTYAVYHMKLRPSEPYDVESTVMSQAYRPGQARNPIANAAVNATRGQILTYRYSVFPAYFHSTCGGKTEDVSRVFAYNSTPPLSGTACPFCSESPLYTWARKVPKARIGQKLQEAFRADSKVGFVRSVEAVPPFGPASRPTAFRVRHSLGELMVPATEFRLAVGPGSKDIPSVYLSSLRDRGDSIEFAGRGFGHGVGMCQYGCQGMASTGKDYRQILAFYYPESELVKLYAL